MVECSVTWQWGHGHPTSTSKQKRSNNLLTAKETEDTQIKDIQSFFSKTIQPKKNKLVSKEPDVIKID